MHKMDRNPQRVDRHNHLLVETPHRINWGYNQPIARASLHIDLNSTFCKLSCRLNKSRVKAVKDALPYMQHVKIQILSGSTIGIYSKYISSAIFCARAAIFATERPAFFSACPFSILDGVSFLKFFHQPWSCRLIRTIISTKNITNLFIYLSSQ